MKFHPEELNLARAYESRHPVDALSDAQMHRIMDRGRSLFKWYKAHSRTHNVINAAVLSFILGSAGWALLGLPRLFLAAKGHDTFWSILLASAVAGSVHSWLMYSLVIFSLHEGAAHSAIFSGAGAFARAGQFLARNVSRLAGADPDDYAACHMAHHAKFGTADDSEFLNFIVPRRYWITFLPFAAYLDFADFLAHRPLTYTRSRMVSTGVSTVYYGSYGYLMYRSFGLEFFLLTMLVFVPHVGFYVDRLRQFSEHNLMPLENRSGARSFGVGFWGLFVGGGPWGQPCHLVHHLVASIPWYQQILLHRELKRTLNTHQKTHFLVTPVIGFPRLLWRVVRDANACVRDRQAQDGEVKQVSAEEDPRYGRQSASGLGA